MENGRVKTEEHATRASVVSIIPPKQTNATIPHLYGTSNGSAINIVDSAKYLGAVIDNELNFKQHIKIMEGKVARSVGILSKLKHFFPQNIMLQLYYALVHPFLSYGIIIWGATYPTYIKRLKSLQNRAIRAVARFHYRDQVKLFYNQLRILQIDDLLKYDIAKFIHCIITRRVARNSQWGGLFEGVWGRSPQPPEANGGLGAKPPAAGGTGVWGRSPQRSKILHFFAKITSF